MKNTRINIRVVFFYTICMFVLAIPQQLQANDWNLQAEEEPEEENNYYEENFDSGDPGLPGGDPGQAPISDYWWILGVVATIYVWKQHQLKKTLKTNN